MSPSVMIENFHPRDVERAGSDYLAMGSILDLATLLDCPALLAYSHREIWFSKRDKIKPILVNHLRTKTAGYWCADVLTWTRLLQHHGF